MTTSIVDAFQKMHCHICRIFQAKYHNSVSSSWKGATIGTRLLIDVRLEIVLNLDQFGSSRKRCEKTIYHYSSLLQNELVYLLCHICETSIWRSGTPGCKFCDCESKLLKTWNQIRVTSLSGCVTKILRLHRMSKIDFQPDFWNTQMLCFSNLYNTMGSKVDSLAVREHFLSRNCLKNSYFGGHDSGSPDFGEG